MLSPYALEFFTEQFNVLNVDDDGITPMKKFAVTTTDIYLKNTRTLGFLVYVLDARLQGNIAELPKWEPRSFSGIYIGH